MKKEQLTVHSIIQFNSMLALFILCAALIVQRPIMQPAQINTSINKAGNIIIDVKLRCLCATIASVEKH